MLCPIMLVQSFPFGRIIARLFVMGGTIAKLLNGLATLSGYRPTAALLN
jgi:hypothetical protein